MALYKDLPEDTIGERIKKMRLKLNIDKVKFAKSIHCELKSVFLWETNKIIPDATSIKKISDTYNIPLDYFHDYYYIYYNNPEEVFLKWKKENGYTYAAISRMLKCHTATIHTFINGKHKLSYNRYIELKKIGVF